MIYEQIIGRRPVNITGMYYYLRDGRYKIAADDIQRQRYYISAYWESHVDKTHGYGNYSNYRKSASELRCAAANNFTAILIQYIREVNISESLNSLCDQRDYVCKTCVENNNLHVFTKTIEKMGDRILFTASHLHALRAAAYYGRYRIVKYLLNYYYIHNYMDEIVFYNLHLFTGSEVVLMRNYIFRYFWNHPWFQAFIHFQETFPEHCRHPFNEYRQFIKDFVSTACICNQTKKIKYLAAKYPDIVHITHVNKYIYLKDIMRIKRVNKYIYINDDELYYIQKYETVDC